MKSFAILAAATMALSTLPVAAQQPSFAGKSMDQLTADEVLKLVRYSYTLYNRDFAGVLRTGFNSKTPFLMDLQPNAIRFIFDQPSQLIHLDTKNKNFALFEGINGQQPKLVNASKYGQKVRGTDVTYEDLSMRFLYWPNAKIVKLDKLKMRECWLVRVHNPDGHGSYRSVDVWIDRASGGMIKMIGLDANGRLIRRFEVLSGKKFGDVWMVNEVRIETLNPTSGQVKSTTRMSIKKVVE